MIPARIQLSRAKGFDLQAASRAMNGLAAVNVARPSRWGNPFAVGVSDNMGRGPIDNIGAVGMFEEMLIDPCLIAAYGYPRDFHSLTGRNLACWCRLDQPCHGDILLRLAMKCEAV